MDILIKYQLQLGVKIFLSKMPDFKEKRHSCTRDSDKQGHSILNVIKERLSFFYSLPQCLVYCSVLATAAVFSKDWLLLHPQTDHELMKNRSKQQKLIGQDFQSNVSLSLHQNESIIRDITVKSH